MREGAIFLGAIPSAARGYMGSLLAASGANNFLNPCAVRFSGVAAAIGSGIPASKIRASDISLFSSAIGFLADPTKKFDDLGIQLSNDLPGSEAIKDEIDIVAQVMLVLKFEQFGIGSQHELNLREQLLASWVPYRADIRRQVQELLTQIHGISYEIGDVFDECAGRTAADMLFFTVPNIRGGYSLARVDCVSHVDLSNHRQRRETARILAGCVERADPRRQGAHASSQTTLSKAAYSLSLRKI